MEMGERCVDYCLYCPEKDWEVWGMDMWKK